MSAPEVDSLQVIAALRRQNADLAYRLAVAEARIAQEQAQDAETEPE